MNNSKLAVDVSLSMEEEKLDNKPYLRQREGELANIIEALGRVAGSEDWKLLRDHVFEGVVESLERKLTAEVHKKERDDAEIDSLNGQLQWAKKYSNLEKLSEIFKVERSNIKKQLNG